MEIDPSTSTSHILSDSSDDDDNHHANLSTEEICNKIKTFRNLCFGNKINVSNAFDIDMIGYFYSWLEKKKSSIFEEHNDDVTSFQEISDYLEASAKVYSYRVDNFSETTSKLVDQFKSMNYNKNTAKTDDNNAPKIQKSRRQKMMLTTFDKLRRKPNENENSVNPALINHRISSFSCSELFSTNRPSHHLNSLYFNKSLAEEMKTSNDAKKKYDEKKNNETIEVDKSFFNMMDILSKGAICPEFKGFVAKHDKIENSNDDQLNGIEYRFDPTNYEDTCDGSICTDSDNDEPDNNEPDNDEPDNNEPDSDEPDNNEPDNDEPDNNESDNDEPDNNEPDNDEPDNNEPDNDEPDNNEPDNNELDSNSNDKNTTVLDGLLECIDNVDRDYSFFNPTLLANWKGPKAWKTQAMMKALKSCTPAERKDIISNTDDNIDEIIQTNIKPPKSCKKRNKVKNDKIQIDWLDMSQITKTLKKKVLSKEKILPRTLQKWDPLDNISDSRSIVVDVKFKFRFLQYAETKPDWWKDYRTLKEDNHSEASNSYENINDYDEGIEQPMEIDCEDSEQLNKITHGENYDKFATLDVSEELNPNADIIADIKTESRMDIAELKKEISNIIDEECVETNNGSEWSLKLSFFNLLLKLRINERDGLSIPIVYVGLLHLANERGLKLFQEHCTINDMEETFIAKPMKKN